MAGVMVSASTGAMNSVLAKLTSLLMEEKMPVAKGIRKQLVFFKEELMMMNGLIMKVADTEDRDSLVKGWMTLVREMTYDLEDILDAFIIHSAAQGKDNKFPRKTARILKRLKFRHRVQEQLQELKQRVIDASERRSRYKLDEAATFSQGALIDVEPRLSALHVKDAFLVGIEGPGEKLIEMLSDSRQQLKVVPIVGFAGLGKTTLAMSVSRRIRELFDCSAFVPVSQRPDTKKILRDILNQVSAHEHASTQAASADERELINALREHLSNKRYFIVIDDVWNTPVWRIIKFGLIENNLGSRVLVTTSIMSVAESCCHPDKDHIFQMGPLTDTEARSLFFNRIFGSKKSCPPEYIETSNDILKKCGGLPLAIITVSSFLASRPYSVRAWEEIRDSVGSSLYKDYSMETMRSILNLSYNDLPHHLKTCLLYLSMFPEDYVIDRKRLVRRWIAEDFVSSRNREDLEEVAEQYLNELINRGLVQSVGGHYDGRVYACQVHDMILDLIVAKSVKENFVITYGKHEHMSGLQDKVRRLSLDSRNPWNTFKPSEIITSHIRSLTVIGSNKEMPALSNFRALRVLDVENFGEFESRYFQNIGRLYLLKYLRLHTTSVIEVPEEIAELQYLETVDLTGAPRSILPKGIVQLKKMVYLLVNNMKLPDGFERMQSLRELSCIKIDGSNSVNTLRGLGHLSMLRTLGLNWCISNIDNEVKVYADMLVSSLSRLGTSHLQSLYIETADGCSLDFLIDSENIACYDLREFQMKSDYYFPTVPKLIASLVNLTLLCINIEIVGEDELQIFGALPTLKTLLLKVKSAASKDVLITRGSGFKCLKQVELTCWKGWTMLMFEPGSMEALEKLQVVYSVEGQCVANGFRFGIQHLTSLKHLVVEIKCRDVNAKEVSAAEDAIMNEVSIHPNRPRLEVTKIAEQYTSRDEMHHVTVEDYEENEGEHEIVVEGEATPKLNAEIAE